MAGADLCTIAEYATRRGCSRQAVEKAIHRKRLAKSIIKREPQVLLDPRLADWEWGANTRRKSDSPQPPAAAQASAGDDDEPELGGDRLRGRRRRRDGDDDGAPVLNFERARKARADADLAELNLARQRGELVALADAKALWFRHWRSHRDRLLAVAEREAAALSATSDPAVCRAIVERAIRGALDDLPPEPPTEEAR